LKDSYNSGHGETAGVRGLVVVVAMARKVRNQLSWGRRSPSREDRATRRGQGSAHDRKFIRLLEQARERVRTGRRR
jgi:hypothetical protein